MSETGIEQERAYKVEQRVKSGVHFLVWMVVYGVAVAVVLIDLFIWRP